MAASWICPSCRQRRRTQYCAECGEERLRPRDLTFIDLAARFARTLSSVDGKLIRSSRAILMTPGALTDSYIRGERRRFLGPLQLFLIANAIFFGVQSLTNTNVLSSSLDSHRHVQDWRDFTQSLVVQRFGKNEKAVAEFAKTFDRAAIFNAKALIFLMVLVFSPIAALLFRKAHRAVGAHIVFSLHLYSFVLLVLCIALVIAEASLLMGGGGLGAPAVDTWLSLANVAACGAYIYLALGAAYSARGTWRIVAAIVMTAAVALLFVGYRFAIFLITFYTA